MNEAILSWAVPVALVVIVMVAKRLSQVSPEEAHRLVREGAKLIDVRTTAEFKSGHLPGAINVPVSELSWREKDLGPKEQVKVIYCASGTRSAVARALMKKQGFTQVFNLGAMRRW